MAVKLILLGAAIAFLSAFRPARGDDCDPPAAPTSRALDVEFDAAVEAFVDRCQRIANPYQSLINRLDADRYADRQAAGAELAAIVAADPSAARWLVRARAVERRPEVRYWLNRTLRAAYRCDRCDGRGYCAVFDAERPEPALYSGVPCRRCGRTEWQHGEQWIDGAYTHYACADCRGFGTHWTHYAVD